MAIKVGESSINQIYVGVNEINKGYLSNDLIYEKVIPDPILISGLVSYWNPDTIDGAAINEGDDINIWADAISGNNATQSGSLRPKLHIAKNGQRQVRFDGSNDWLQVGQPSNLLFPNASDNMTIVSIIGELAPSRGYFISNRTPSGSPRRWSLFIETPTQIGSHRLNFGNIDNYSAGVSANDVYILPCATSNRECFVNGVSAFIENNGVSSVSTDINIGGRSNGSWLYNGDISRIAVYNRVLSATEIQAISDYYNP